LTTNRSSKSTSTNRENHKEPRPRAWIQGLQIKEIALHGTTPTPPRPKRPQDDTDAAPIQDARVHYAVPKQQPRRTPDTRTRTSILELRGLGHARDNRNNVHREHRALACAASPCPVASGPNSAPRTRRTRSTGPFQPASGRTRTGTKHSSGPRFVDIPPMSARRTTQGSATGNTEHPPHGRAERKRC
jgi:hypothetical protein